MKRSRFKNKANKTKSCNGIINYKKQRNLVVKLNNKSKFEHFNKYDPKKQAKPFWVNCKPYFSNKHNKADTNIMFSELIPKNSVYCSRKKYIRFVCSK